MKKRLLPAIVVLLILALGLCVMSCGEESPKVSNGDEAPTNGDAEDTLNLQVGQAAETSKVRVTVVGADRVNSYTWEVLEPDDTTEEASPGKTFIIIDARIENIDADFFWVSNYDLSITDSQGYKYDPELYFRDDDFPSQELYKGQQSRGKILFEVPESATGLKVVYDFGLWETKLATWDLQFEYDETAPSISAVSSSAITATTATITWITNEAATSQVEYGTTTAYGSSSVSDSTRVTSHSVSLTGLTASTTYHYRVKSQDSSGNEAMSGDYTFATNQPAIDILSHSSYLDGIGWYNVVGELKNTSSDNLEFVKLIATFYDSGGTVIDTDYTFTDIDVLVPDQKSPFELVLLDSQTSAEVDHYVLNSDFSITTEEPYREFDILSHSSHIDAFGWYNVVGEVKNTGTESATFVMIVGTFYDAAGTVIAKDFCYAGLIGDLAAGQTKPFEMIELDTTISAQIASYDLQVQC